MSLACKVCRLAIAVHESRSISILNKNLRLNKWRHNGQEKKKTG